MSYKVLSIEAKEEVILSKVELTFGDGTKKEIEISFFQPDSKEYIIDSIANREASEIAKKTAIERNKSIVADLKATAFKDAKVNVSLD